MCENVVKEEATSVHHCTLLRETIRVTELLSFS